MSGAVKNIMFISNTFLGGVWLGFLCMSFNSWDNLFESVSQLIHYVDSGMVSKILVFVTVMLIYKLV